MKWLLAMLGLGTAVQHLQSNHMDRLRQVSSDLSREAAVGESRVQDVIYRTATTNALAKLDVEETKRRSAAREETTQEADRMRDALGKAMRRTL